MPEGEPREPLRPALVRELDSGLSDVAAPLAQHVGHRLDHPEALLGVRVVDEQNPGSRGADVARGHGLIPRVSVVGRAR